MRKKLPNGTVPFEGPPIRRKTSLGPGGRGIPKPGDDASLNNVVRLAKLTPPGVRRSGNDPRGKVAYEVPQGRRKLR